jgi:hypothetical protein
MINLNACPRQDFHELEEPTIEADLQVIVVKYYFRFIQPNFTDTVLIVNPFSEARLSNAQISQAKAQGWRKSQPDILIISLSESFNGLALELKRFKSNPYKKDGTLKKQKLKNGKDHLQEQYNELVKLSNNGFKAHFSVGLKETLSIIDEYFEI